MTSQINGALIKTKIAWNSQSAMHEIDRVYMYKVIDDACIFLPFPVA